MGTRINALVRRANARCSALSFTVIVPGSTSHHKASRLLAKSPYLRRMLSAPNRRHAYHEGRQHELRPGKLRLATCDTAVYFIQSDAANKKWPPTDALCEELLAALSATASAHGSASAPTEAGEEVSRVGSAPLTPSAPFTPSAPLTQSAGEEKTKPEKKKRRVAGESASTVPTRAAVPKRARVHSRAPAKRRSLAVRAALLRVDSCRLLPQSRILGTKS